MSIANRLEHGRQEFVLELRAWIVEKRGALRSWDLDVVLAPQHPLDAAGQLPQGTPKPFQSKRVQVDEDAHVPLAQLALQVVQDRRLSRTPLTVQDNDVVTVAAHERLSDEV